MFSLCSFFLTLAISGVYYSNILLAAGPYNQWRFEMTKPAKQLVHVTVSKPLLAAVDQLAARQYRSRSEWIRQAVLKELEAQGVCPLHPQVAA
jgi:hypothetical protein